MERRNNEDSSAYQGASVPHAYSVLSHVFSLYPFIKSLILFIGFHVFHLPTISEAEYSGNTDKGGLTVKVPPHIGRGDDHNTKIILAHGSVRQAFLSSCFGK